MMKKPFAVFFWAPLSNKWMYWNSYRTWKAALYSCTIYSNNSGVAIQRARQGKVTVKIRELNK